MKEENTTTSSHETCPVYTSPHLSKPCGKIKRVFLAGSIEMGLAENWQQQVINTLKDELCVIYNPRRDDWDDSWEQSADNPKFYEQVSWELMHLQKADIIIMYFDPNTKSHITLLEFGLYARSNKLLVCCPDNFWRKGNVDVVCQTYGVPTFNNLDTLLVKVKQLLYS